MAKGQLKGNKEAKKPKGGQAEGFGLGLQAVAGQRRSGLEPDRDEEGLRSQLARLLEPQRPPPASRCGPSRLKR